jgi:hypothetical protein
MTTHPSPSPLVQTEWLAAHLDDADVRIVDVRFRSRAHLGRGNLIDDRAGYMAGHIPGAVFVGTVTELSDPQHPVPDMLVPPEQFAQVMGRLGIGDDTLVVAYDGMGLPVGAARSMAGYTNGKQRGDRCPPTSPPQTWRPSPRGRGRHGSPAKRMWRRHWGILESPSWIVYFPSCTTVLRAIYGVTVPVISRAR